MKDGDLERIIIVSNRLPISVEKKRNTLIYVPSVGGLATGLESLVKKSDGGQWIGWPGIASDDLTGSERRDITRHLKAEGCVPLFLTSDDVEGYYEGFSNKTIWPLFHYFNQYARFETDLWESYVRVNRLFANAVIDMAKPNDLVWVHDYQLLLVPGMIREARSDVTIGFFLHIPFPSYEVFSHLPWRVEILEGMLGADLLGFHTYDYVRHFISSVRRRLGHDISAGQITLKNRIARAEVHPMGIDYDKYASAPKLPQVQKEMKKYSTRLKELKIILSVDRLDYSKGIMLRLEAFDRFLDKYTEYREKVVMILVAVPSREGVEQYQLKRELDEHVGRINGKHATFGWMPVWYQYNSLPFHALTALYAIADVALLTPIRDGMNLIAKEFIATKDEGRGVLVLSETAGAAKELSEAIIVNPYHIEKVADSIKLALILPEDEQVQHTRIMQNRLKRYSVTQWADTFIADLHDIKQGQEELHARKLSPAIRERMIKEYRKSTRRLFLLDYDGTLRAFESRPELAVPDETLSGLVKKLADDPKNEVCIISGRDRNTLGTWFSKCGVNLIAEHGVWIRDKNCDWEMIEPLMSDWKDEIRGLMEIYMDRTPGSFIEEKDYSLVWHYRRADPEQASIRSNELKDELLYRVTNLGVGVLEGNKVIEVKNIGINKGVGGRRWLTREKFDFVFAAGDDWTDEDLFNVLDDKAYSVKVGISFSRARFTVETVGDVLELLGNLAEVKV